MKLVIVESPAKAKTIKRFLGRDFEVIASYGHIKDLPKSRLGVRIDEGFEPEYQLIPSRKKQIKEIKEKSKMAEEIFLASDPDREGEAIAWHIAEEIRDSRTIKRAVFHEITEKGIKEGINNPRDLDENLYNAQKARRVLDRLVGYKISPLLWDKVKRGISAGRVQSVALKFIVEREKEIEAFVPREYWTISAVFEKDGKRFSAELKTKEVIPDELSAKKILEEIKGKEFLVQKVTKKERRVNPPPPYITSTLQQDAFKKLGFTAERTMRIAQTLYEGVDAGPFGRVGLITYMRTDSVRIADEAIGMARQFIEEKFGRDYLPENPRIYKNKESAQDAHEAIRPTDVKISPSSIKDYISKDECKLYEIIWRRFLACQMNPALYESVTAELICGNWTFKASGSRLLFDGFKRVYDDKEEGEEEDVLPPLQEGEILKPLDIKLEQHWTKPPPRYNESSLIKELEEKGIGRPSTYATIISTLKKRGYVKVQDGRFYPTTLGNVVCELLLQHFTDIMDTGFTAKMERELDLVERGEEEWRRTVSNFYSLLKGYLEKAEKEIEVLKGKGIKTDLKCPLCGGDVVIKIGKNGEFIACRNYPQCSFTSNFKRETDGKIVLLSGEKIDGKCPQCGSPLLVKWTKRGQRFIACSSYPSCKWTSPYKTGEKCPSCGADLVERISKRGKIFTGCERYPECKFIKKSSK
jgi:DNA topoisomerase-1